MPASLESILSETYKSPPTRRSTSTLRPPSISTAPVAVCVIASSAEVSTVIFVVFSNVAKELILTVPSISVLPFVVLTRNLVAVPLVIHYGILHHHQHLTQH